MRRIRSSVAMSLDGYIAGPIGEYDWIVSAIIPVCDGPEARVLLPTGDGSYTSYNSRIQSVTVSTVISTGVV